MTDTERRDVVNDDLTLIQRTAGLNFGTDALLLAAYVQKCEGFRAIEFGGGSGIVSLLLATRKKVGTIECVEIQPACAGGTRRKTGSRRSSRCDAPTCGRRRHRGAYMMPLSRTRRI